MIVLPEVLGMTFAHRADALPHERGFCLLGVFQSLHLQVFPTPPLSFVVYSALYGGVGEGTIELVILRLETEEDVYRYRRWSVFPGREHFVNLAIPVKKCILPAPGRYSVALRFDDRDLSRRFLPIYQR